DRGGGLLREETDSEGGVKMGKNQRGEVVHPEGGEDGRGDCGRGVGRSTRSSTGLMTISFSFSFALTCSGSNSMNGSTSGAALGFLASSLSVSWEKLIHGLLFENPPTSSLTTSPSWSAEANLPRRKFPVASFNSSARTTAASSQPKRANIQ